MGVEGGTQTTVMSFPPIPVSSHSPSPHCQFLPIEGHSHQHSPVISSLLNTLPSPFPIQRSPVPVLTSSNFLMSVFSTLIPLPSHPHRPTVIRHLPPPVTKTDLGTSDLTWPGQWLALGPALPCACDTLSLPSAWKLCLLASGPSCSQFPWSPLAALSQPPLWLLRLSLTSQRWRTPEIPFVCSSQPALTPLASSVRLVDLSIYKCCRVLNLHLQPRRFSPELHPESDLPATGCLHVRV